MSTYYAVHKGRQPGIYSTWNECKKQVDKFVDPIFKKFTSKEEAEVFYKNGFGDNKKPRKIVRKENDDKKNEAIIDKELNEDIPLSKIIIYTDGSHIKSKTSSKAGFGIYIPSKNIKVAAPLLNQKLTNNRAELTAIIESIKYLDEKELEDKICIFTDSQYSKYIFDGTGERYEKNNYKDKDGKDVPNIDLIKKMLEMKRKYNIVLLKVRAHTDKKDQHSIANAIADKLANEGAFANQQKDNKDGNNLMFNELFEIDSLDLTNKSMMNEIHTNLNKNNYIKPSSNNSNNSKNILENSLVNTKLSQWFSKVKI